VIAQAGQGLGEPCIGLDRHRSYALATCLDRGQRVFHPGAFPRALGHEVVLLEGVRDEIVQLGPGRQDEAPSVVGDGLDGAPAVGGGGQERLAIDGIGLVDRF